MYKVLDIVLCANQGAYVKPNSMVVVVLSAMIGAIMILSSDCSTPSGGANGGGAGSLNQDIFAAWKESKDYKEIVKSTDGTAVSTVAELKGMKAEETYHLTQDIDLKDEAWQALHSSDPFTGTLHGNGYVIRNVMTSSTVNYQGVFSSLDGATVRDLGIGVKNIAGSSIVGGLAGKAANSNLTNIAVAPMDADAKLHGRKYVGGMVGELKGGTLKGYNLGLEVQGVSGNVGGLVGFMDFDSGTVLGYARSTVRRASGSDAFFGKIAGKLRNSDAAKNIIAYSSTAEEESQVLQSDGAVLLGDGFYGTAVSVDAAAVQRKFPALDFTNGPWVWVANGKWPAINIGDLGGNSAPAKHPIDP